MDSDLKRREPRRHGRLRLCVLVTLAAVILLFVLLLVLALTVFRARHAVTTINSIRLASLNAGLDLPNFSVDLNVTLALEVIVYNPNHVNFRYLDGGTAELYYRSKHVGEAVIPPGDIGAKGTETIGVVLTVLAGHLIRDASVYADVIAGSVDLTTYTTIAGKVAIFGVFKHHVVSYATCDVTVNIRNRTVENSNCRYKTKL